MIYKSDGFGGINQSVNLNSLPTSDSYDACNIDTSFGNISVAKGFIKHIKAQVPFTDIQRLFIWNGKFIVISSNIVYCYDENEKIWVPIYVYPATAPKKFDCVHAQIDGVDHIIISCNNYRPIKYNGTTATLFGSPEGLSDKEVLYVAMYKNRLFSAGDKENPNRLYFSQLPGSGRTIESWAYDESSPNIEGGHIQVGDNGGDYIVALKALSTQLIIFKKNSIYRLLGDKPSNFIIEKIDSVTESASNSAIVQYLDALYYMTNAGMYVYNGVASYLMNDAKKILDIIRNSDTTQARSAITREKIYFSIKENGSDALIEYDFVRRTYMIRRGFDISDICAYDGRVYLINNAGYVYLFDEGDSYDGVPIEAWWSMPKTDLHDKSVIKRLRELYLRSGSNKDNEILIIDVEVDSVSDRYRVLMPSNDYDVLEIPLRNEGRVFSITFRNESGGHFSISGGIELAFDARERSR